MGVISSDTTVRPKKNHSRSRLKVAMSSTGVALTPGGVHRMFKAGDHVRVENGMDDKGLYNHWSFQDPKMKVPTISKAYFSGLCKGISPQNMALYGTVPPI